MAIWRLQKRFVQLDVPLIITITSFAIQDSQRQRLSPKLIGVKRIPIFHLFCFSFLFLKSGIKTQECYIGRLSQELQLLKRFIFIIYVYSYAINPNIAKWIACISLQRMTMPNIRMIKLIQCRVFPMCILADSSWSITINFINYNIPLFYFSVCKTLHVLMCSRKDKIK